VVVGSSGSGKTTVAIDLAKRLGVPHIELDSIYHQPGWQPLPEEEFKQSVAAATSGIRWVIDGNYSAVWELVWSRADAVVILAYPRRLVTKQLFKRTIVRVVSRQRLWNSNREPWSNLFSWNPEKNIIRWSWTNHDKYHHRYLDAMSDPRWSHITFLRLTHPQQTAIFLRGLSMTTPANF
jgi:adenylate kinase family enzyme